MSCSSFRSLEPLLHQPAEGGVQVAVVEQIVAHLVEQRLGVEIEAGLAAVPRASIGTRDRRFDGLTVPPRTRRPTSGDPAVVAHAGLVRFRRRCSRHEQPRRSTCVVALAHGFGDVRAEAGRLEAERPPRHRLLGPADDEREFPTGVASPRRCTSSSTSRNPRRLCAPEPCRRPRSRRPRRATRPGPSPGSTGRCSVTSLTERPDRFGWSADVHGDRSVHASSPFDSRARRRSYDSDARRGERAQCRHARAATRRRRSCSSPGARPPARATSGSSLPRPSKAFCQADVQLRHQTAEAHRQAVEADRARREVGGARAEGHRGRRADLPGRDAAARTGRHDRRRQPEDPGRGRERQPARPPTAATSTSRTRTAGAAASEPRDAARDHAVGFSRPRTRRT